MEEVEFKFLVDYTKPAFYCGLDVHKYELAVAVYCKDDSQSELLKTNIFSVDSAGLNRFWSFVSKFRPEGFVMEATGIYHHVIYRFLVKKREHIAWSFKILVVNPADASGIPNRQKNDKIDAENLAKYLAMGLLKSGKPVIEIIEDLKAIFRMALRIERDRTALKNRIKKTLDRAGIRPKGLDLNLDWVREFLHYFIGEETTLGGSITQIQADLEILKSHRHKIFKNAKKFVPYYDFSLSHAQRSMVRQDLVELDFKTARKRLLAVEIDQLILERPALRQEAYNLSTIPGISPFSAVWILAEIGNIRQFHNVKQFLAYCGCAPRIVSSAGKTYSAHISRHSNSYLRTIFYNAAVVLCNLEKKDSVLKEYGKRIIERKQSVSMTLVYCIVAAKIARISYALLKTSAPFNPRHGWDFNKTHSKEAGSRFSLTSKNLIRKARNSLRRVGDVQELGLLGDRVSLLAEQLDLLLQRKKFSD
jgi:transposase